ncbi:uncharacterized protein LOC133680414 isoform X2 [Populus nigra]|uniref:uncharacterized protein LOC133680414 isoform X2 n=1 Tax=Populus nigra TaxID=3691 RepID=UPI002B278A4B|nr:uncharacterized protein LOC133680414 isoform X2 [Populus nigra]
MDPRYTGEILKHLEKQNELLTSAYNSMSHELHKLQVEEEMLMRKFYDLMAAQGISKKCSFLAVNKLKRSENEESELVEAKRRQQQCFGWWPNRTVHCITPKYC